MTVAEKLLRAKQDLDEVFEAGKAQGGGGDSYYDTFWDSAKDTNGEISGFLIYCFGGLMWNDITFNPPCNIRPSYGANIFAQSKITDLKGILERNNVTLDFSNCTNFNSITEGATITRLPVIDTRGAKELRNFLYNAEKLVSVDKVILKDDGSQATMTNTFKLLPSLVEIRFEGVIGANVDIRDSVKLSAESLNSIMTHLSTTATGVSVTLPPYDIVKATYDAVYGEGAWDILAASKTNWTIAYS